MQLLVNIADILNIHISAVIANVLKDVSMLSCLLLFLDIGCLESHICGLLADPYFESACDSSGQHIRRRIVVFQPYKSEDVAQHGCEIPAAAAGRRLRARYRPAIRAHGARGTTAELPRTISRNWNTDAELPVPGEGRGEGDDTAQPQPRLAGAKSPIGRRLMEGSYSDIGHCAAARRPPPTEPLPSAPEGAAAPTHRRRSRRSRSRRLPKAGPNTDPDQPPPFGDTTGPAGFVAIDTRVLVLCSSADQTLMLCAPTRVVCGNNHRHYTQTGWMDGRGPLLQALQDK